MAMAGFRALITLVWSIIAATAHAGKIHTVSYYCHFLFANIITKNVIFVMYEI